MMNQYETDRLNETGLFRIVEIDGEDAYDEATNTIRVVYPNGSVCRTFLLATGTFTEPHPDRHLVIHLHAGELRPFSPEAIVSGIGFLVDIKRFEEWKVKAHSLPSVHVKAPGEAGVHGDYVIKGRGGDDATGISIREDGSIVLRATGSEIVLGDGITMMGVLHREDPETRNGILKSNPLRQFVLPSFCAIPLPAELPTTGLFSTLGGLVKGML